MTTPLERSNPAPVPPTAEVASPGGAGGANIAWLSDHVSAFVVNGRFTSQRMTGVQRVACELTDALQRLLPAQRHLPVIVPHDARSERRALRDEVKSRWLRGMAWEQLILPFATRGHTLLSLCNMGPLWKRQQIVMIHDMAVFDEGQNYSWKFRWWYRFAFWMLRLNARHIVTVSSFSRERIVKHLHIDESRISIVRNAVDHFDRIEREPSILTRLDLVADRYVLFVGSLAVSKNLARVLSAIKFLDGGRDFKFVIVGRSNPRVFSGKHQEVEDLPPDVVMAGAVSDEELKSLYENAGCFLFPSLYEGFGLPPLEAMYCGCPVIVSREASLPEVCGDAAMYCDAYSVADIAHKITNMMGDANLRDRYRLLGREHARQYRWDVSARALLGVLDKIAP